MVFVVIGLVVLVGFMAAKSPAPSGSGQPTLGPDTNVPALGATDKFSPALTGGMPLISRSNRVRLGTNYRNVESASRMDTVRDVPPPGTGPGVFGGMTNASSDGGYARETKPATVQTDPDPNQGYQVFKF